MTPSSRHIAIVGAGPSGLMAAETLARVGHRVTIHEHMPSAGRKMLMAGRGGLNLTHGEPLEAFLGRYGAARDWLAPAIRAFPPEALRAWCEGLGQETFIGSSRRVFPRDMKAASLLRAWLRRLETLDVRLAARHDWRGWEGDALRFVVDANETILLRPDATLLALGGASWPRLGSDGAWTGILRGAGVEIAPLRPANCGFTVPWSAHFSSRFAGLPLKPVTLSHAGNTRQGEIMVTAQGIEGGGVYALSAGLRDAIEAEGEAVLHLDLRPGMPVEAIARKLRAAPAHQSLSTCLRKAGLSPLAIGLLRESAGAELLRLGAVALAERLKALPLRLTATAGMDRAISSAGGVPRAALTEDFMLRAKPGVFVAGEMLDWEAPTGGYLLQACFSTAVAAAEGIRRFL